MERSNRSLLRLRLFVGMKSAEKSKGSSESARRLLVQFSSARFLSQTPVKLLVVAPLSSSSSLTPVPTAETESQSLLLENSLLLFRL